MIQSKFSINTDTYINNMPAFLVSCPNCKSGFYTANVDKKTKVKCKKCENIFHYLIKTPLKYVIVEVV